MTVHGATPVKFWPLVDVAKLDPRPGDVMVARVMRRNEFSEAVRGRVREDLERAYPGVVWAVVIADEITFAVARNHVEMVEGDL